MKYKRKKKEKIDGFDYINPLTHKLANIKKSKGNRKIMGKYIFNHTTNNSDTEK